MLSIAFANHWDFWTLKHKVTIDGSARTITVNPDVTTINIQTDIFSDWKEWARLHDHLKFTRAIRSIGGDATTGIQKAGDIYFMMNNWRVVIDLSKTSVTGVIFSDDYDTPFVSFDGKPVNQSLVSSLVTSVTTTENVVTNAPTAEEISAAVWVEAIRSLTVNTGLTTEESTKLLGLPSAVDNKDVLLGTTSYP